MKKFLIFGIVPLLLFSGDYYGGDGIVEIIRGEWISGDKINLNINDSLYFTVSNVGGVKTPQVFGAVPKPMDGNCQGTWAVIFSNPTANPITVSRIDIIQPNGHLLFNGITGVNPVSGWNLVSQSNARWSGTMNIPAHSAFDFICLITGTGASYIDGSIRLVATTNVGTFENNTFSTSSGNILPCANISFIKNGTTFYLSGLYSNENNQYLLKLFESSNVAAIDSGTNLFVTIPPFFKNVTTGVNPDFLNPTITYDSTMGWTISTSLLRSLLNDSAMFNFSAVSPSIGGKSLYPLNVNFGQAKAQGIVQVLPPPATGDSGQIDTVSLFVVCPNPMDKNTYGVWGGVVVNPTENTIFVNQFNIVSQPGSNIFNNVAGVKPATGWSRVNFNTIRWTGNLILPPHGAIEFICNIKGNNKNASDVSITFNCVTSQGNYTGAGSTNQSREGIPYANLYYLVAGSASGLISGIQSGSMKNFVVQVSETGRQIIPSGTTLKINIPPKWSNVTAPANQAGFNPPIITGNSIIGWTITTTTNAVLTNSYRNFQFSAQAPNVAIDAYYLFPTQLINTTTTPNINSICKAVVGVLNPTSGIVVNHTSPEFIEPNYSISAIDINLIYRASRPEFGFLSIYNFNNSQWETLVQSVIDTTETSFFNSIMANTNNYLSASNQILIRNATIDNKGHSISEDFLYYRTSSFYVIGIDRAPSVVNRGQDSVVMMRLDFNSGLGSHSIASLRIYLSGTGVITDVSGVKLFDDLNRNGFLDPGEPQVGTTQVFNAGGIATFIGNPLFSFSDVMPKSILIVYTINNLAGLGNYVGVDIMSSNDILTSTHLPVPGIYPISSTQARITQGAPVIHWSYASPDSIIPDSLEITTVFARVTDPQGQGDIQRVKIDCQPIGGDSVVVMFDNGSHGDSIPGDGIYTRNLIKAAPGTPPGTYYLEIEAMDLADTCSRADLQLFIKDIEPPHFNTRVLNDTTFTGPFVVKSEITDLSGIFTDSLYYKINQGLFYAVSKDSISGGVYHYTIPQQSVYDTIYYYLSATDNRSNRGTDPENVPDSIYHFIILGTTGTFESRIQSKSVDFKIFPNPARNKVNIFFNSDIAINVQLRIYDVTGRLIRDFTDNLESRTLKSVSVLSWDGTDECNRKVPQGVYFLLFECREITTEAKEMIVRKIIFIR